MPNHIRLFPGVYACLAVAGFCSSTLLAHADATLVYETVTADAAKTVHTFSIRGRFVRVDMDSDPDRHWVIDTGLLTIADVDRAKQEYTFEKLPRPRLPGAATAAEKDAVAKAAVQAPEGKEAPSGETSGAPQGAGEGPGPEEGAAAAARLSPGPVLVPSRKKESVAGIGCRLVTEKADNQPIAEHCMAGTGLVGLTSREMITLSRLLTTARRLGLGWAGVATADERIVSVRSRLLDSEARQELRSVSYESLPNELMQVPKTYKRIKTADRKQDRTAPEDAEAAVTGGG